MSVVTMRTAAVRPPSSPILQSPLARAAAAVVAAAGRIAARRRPQEDLFGLEGLTARELSDIGLVRVGAAGSTRFVREVGFD
jgi:uncharacterized protein YjiS (DUF1127 family)